MPNRATVILGALLLCGPAPKLLAQSAVGGCEMYEPDLLRSALKMQSKGIVMGTIQKHLGRLGDRATAGLLKVIGEQDWANPEKIRPLLPVIRAAFGSPEFIAMPEDKKPDVTFLFLEHIRSHVDDKGLAQEVVDLEAFVARQTGVPAPLSVSGGP